MLNTTDIPGSSRFDTTLSVSDFIHDAVRSVLHQTELKRLPYELRVIAANRLSKDADGHLVFLRVDRYQPYLMQRSQRIERYLVQCIRLQFDIIVQQVYWRWGDDARIPEPVNQLGQSSAQP
ncbi:hypothetical protein [Ideonella sp.]|uniref:hypothetical protein n=1 Tax=Ideonella sp. TaxID=1929293 RepID=UPI003BB740E5